MNELNMKTETEAEINELFERTNLTPRISKLSHLDQIRVAVFSAEKVLHLCESKAPRLAIESAKDYIADPTEENKEKCRIAANFSGAALAVANSANVAGAAGAVANSVAVASAANAAVNAVVYASDAVAIAAHAAALADVYASDELKREILDYLVELEMGDNVDEQQVIPRVGQQYEFQGVSKSIDKVVNGSAIFDDLTCSDLPLRDSYEFKPANDLEWLAVNEEAWCGDDNRLFIRRYCERIIGYRANGGLGRYSEQQWQDKRNELYGEIEVLKPKMNVSYEKVDADFEFWRVAKEHDECGCFYYLFDGEQSEIKSTSITVLASQYKNKKLYRRIETPVTWMSSLTEMLKDEISVSFEDVGDGSVTIDGQISQELFVKISHFVASLTDKPNA